MPSGAKKRRAAKKKELERNLDLNSSSNSQCATDITNNSNDAHQVDSLLVANVAAEAFPEAEDESVKRVVNSYMETKEDPKESEVKTSYECSSTGQVLKQNDTLFEDSAPQNLELKVDSNTKEGTLVVNGNEGAVVDQGKVLQYQVFANVGNDNASHSRIENLPEVLHGDYASDNTVYGSVKLESEGNIDVDLDDVLKDSTSLESETEIPLSVTVVVPELDSKYKSKEVYDDNETDNLLSETVGPKENVKINVLPSIAENKVVLHEGLSGTSLNQDAFETVVNDYAAMQLSQLTYITDQLSKASLLHCTSACSLSKLAGRLSEREVTTELKNTGDDTLSSAKKILEEELLATDRLRTLLQELVEGLEAL